MTHNDFACGKMISFTMKIIRLISLIIIGLTDLTMSMPAFPLYLEDEQPDGSSIFLKMNGDMDFNYVTDSHGYPVVEDEESGFSYYGDVETTTGRLKSTGIKVGIHPLPAGLNKTLPRPPANFTKREYPKVKKFLKRLRRRFWRPGKIEGNEDSSEEGYEEEDEEYYFTYEQQEDDEEYVEESEEYYYDEQVQTHLTNLVVLMCFADHDCSKLPQPSEYEALFNENGYAREDELEATTGSVRDVFTVSSYGKLRVDSIIYPWIRLGQTEKYYADESWGTSDKLHEAFHEALDVIDQDYYFDWWSVYDDKDEDKVQGLGITFIHSGYGAEFGGRDCRSRKWKNRVWSHMAKMKKWKSKWAHGVKLKYYQVAPGLYGRDRHECKYEITRVGVVAHELAHFLGLDDHYDGKNGGYGIGFYGLMGNAWGRDFSQMYPPIMCPYNKILLGWAKAVEIKKDGVYTIANSNNFPDFYKITKGFAESEYLLIENRQPQGFEKKLPQGGLFIWHVDERAEEDNPGFPLQKGWPENSNHYKIALLQADGMYNLETGLNFGDGTDPFHDGGVDKIGPGGIAVDFVPIRRYPNTDSYQYGHIQNTDHVIDRISESGDTMTFRVRLNKW